MASITIPVTISGAISLICDTRVLQLFENVSTGLATTLRFSFAMEAGGLSPRLCIVRDLTLCRAVSAAYTVNSTVNTAEVDAQGGWTGGFTAPLSSAEAVRIIPQGTAPAGRRRLMAVYSAIDTAALQLLLNAALAGVLSIDVVVTTAASNAGQVVACLLSSGCAGGNFSGVPPASIAPPAYDSSGGAVVTLSSAGGIQLGALEAAGPTAGTWALAQVIAALANATNSTPAAFLGFVNLSSATIAFERAAAASASPSPRRSIDPGSALTAIGAAIGSLGALGLLAFAARRFWQALGKRGQPQQRPPVSEALGAQRSHGTLALRAHEP